LKRGQQTLHQMESLKEKESVLVSVLRHYNANTRTSNVLFLSEKLP
jgi:hypothetical protein